MRAILTIISLFIIIKASFAQLRKNSIELSVFTRYDVHADYSSRYANRSYEDHLLLSGLGYGASVAYKRRCKGDVFFKLGAGYYKLSIDRIKDSGSPFGPFKARNIAYDDHSTRLLYYTPNYFYNILQLSAGIEKEFYLRDNLGVTIGSDFLYYYTFSQRYNLDHLNNQDDYKAHNNRSLGNCIVVQIGLTKQFSSQQFVTPKLIIPVYQSLNTDPVFLEGSGTMDKWFRGIGLSLTVGRYF